MIRRAGALAAVGAVALAVGLPARAPALPSDEPDRPPRNNWKMYGKTPQRTFSTLNRSLEEDTVLRLEEKWRHIIPNPSGFNSVTASPTVYKGVVYFGDWGGNFYAVDIVDGSLVWNLDLRAKLERYLERRPRRQWDDFDDRAAAIFSTALAYKGRIYTGVNQLMFALDAKTGKVRWKRNIMDRVTRLHGDNGAPFYSSPTVAYNPSLGRKVVYVGGPSTDCVRGVLRAIHPSNGRFLWSYFIDGGRGQRPGERKPDGSPAMGGGIWTSPAVKPNGRTAFITTSNACGVPPQPRLAPALIAVKTAKGRRKSAEKRMRWYARPRSHDVDDRAIANTPNYMANVTTPGGRTVDLVGYADKDGSYRAYWARDIDRNGRGDRIWRTDVAPSSDGSTGGGFVGGGTAYTDGRIFAGSFLGPPFMHAFDAWTGDVAWQSEQSAPTFGGVSAANDLVFKGDEFSPEVKIYDAADGAVLRRLTTPETVVGAPALVQRHVIVTLGSSRPWEGLQTHPEGIGVMAFVLPDSGATPPVDPNPPLPELP